jgi:chorismate mutase
MQQHKRKTRKSTTNLPNVKLRALRGATTCDENTKAEIDAKTQELMAALLARNELEHDDLVSVIFTATDDLTAEFPATAARALGLGDVPLLCARELAIDHGMARVIRVLVHCYSDRDEHHHVYLGGARALRDDLPE